ncbi:MAG: PDGLE domain-containing protein [Candidatus Omnitrophica bacterium]|nr:PDGLE domain-containing protein [Candidatus Omnitrophota bacterium]
MKPQDIIIGLGIAFILAIFISPFASPFLDGLEKVAEQKGFLEKGEEAVLSSPIPDYIWPGVKNEGVATAIAGVAGTVVTFFAAWSLALLLRRSQP